MKNPQECDTLLDVREAIDFLDHSIIQALARRMEYVKSASRFKPNLASISAPDRVAAMLPQRGAWAQQQGLDAAFIQGLFSTIIHWYIAQQIQHWATRNCSQ